MQPDLGTLLEISISAEPLGEALADLVALGLRDVPVADFVPGARAVVSDGTLNIGLHDAEVDGPAPTFVRPGLAEHVRRLEEAGVELETLELGEDRFHRAAFRDPSGMAVHLIEARSFTSVDPDPGLVPVCGRFVELSVSTGSLEGSTSFWHRLGMTTVGEGEGPHPWRRLQGYGLTLGLHESGGFNTALTFHAPGLDARIEYLRAKGFEPRRSAPLAPRGSPSATLVSPGGLRLYLLEDFIA